MDLPKDFVTRTRNLLGEKEFEKLEQGMNTPSPTSIRINPFKWENKLSEERVEWCENGYYLKQRKPFTFDPLFHAGAYYVQEAASMFLDKVIKEYIDTPVTALDLCAAPGGKSTLIRSALPAGSLLFANEYVKNRSQILAENIIKWGNSDVIVTNNSPSDYSKFKNLFDFILTDVPCSGEGMFRKDEMAISEWSVDNVLNCQKRQKEILTDIWGTLKENGILVYSTCTYNQEENEDNVKWIVEELGAEILQVPIDESWNISGALTNDNLSVYRFLPHRTKGEGLFMAVLRKKFKNVDSEDYDSLYLDERKENKKNKKGIKGNNKAAAVPENIKQWIKNSDEFIFESDETTITAIPKKIHDIYQMVKGKLRIIHHGIEIATIKGKDFIPSHSLALSTCLNRTKFCSVELDYNRAIAYLRKEAIVIDDSYPKGYVLFTYRGRPIGFAKNIGNRTNNLYPQEWRIRSSYTIEDDPSII